MKQTQADRLKQLRAREIFNIDIELPESMLEAFPEYPAVINMQMTPLMMVKMQQRILPQLSQSRGIPVDLDLVNYEDPLVQRIAKMVDIDTHDELQLARSTYEQWSAQTTLDAQLIAITAFSDFSGVPVTPWSSQRVINDDEDDFLPEWMREEAAFEPPELSRNLKDPYEQRLRQLSYLLEKAEEFDPDFAVRYEDQLRHVMRRLARIDWKEWVKEVDEDRFRPGKSGRKVSRKSKSAGKAPVQGQKDTSDGEDEADAD